MRWISAAIFMAGCAVPQSIEAPVIIVPPGSNQVFVKEVPTTYAKKTYWSIEILDREQHKDWSFHDIKVGEKKFLAESDNWTCFSNMEFAYPKIQQVVVECTRKDTYMIARTRGVSCGVLEKDTVDYERDSLAIYITCDER